MKKAPDRIYLRVAPSGAIMPVVHTKPAEGSQKSIEYVRADTLPVSVLLEINKRKVVEWIGPDGTKHRTYRDDLG